MRASVLLPSAARLLLPDVAAANELNDLDAVAIVDVRALPIGTPDDLPVYLNRDPLWRQ